MKTSLTLVLASLALAGRAAAATTADLAAPPAAEPHKVEGLTVTGKRPKACNSRDKDCIAAVLTELKLRYPEKFQAWCVQQGMEAAREGFVEQQWGVSGSETKSYEPTPVIKGACVANKK